MEKKMEPIYVDQNGYNEILKEIELLKKKLNENNLGRRAAYDAGAGDGWDSPEFEEIERNENLILGELQRRYDELSRIVIIEKENNSDIVDIGDIITANMMYDVDDSEELTFLLIGGVGGKQNEYQEVSINSPLGKSVYKKHVGDTCSYEVGRNIINVFIKEKIGLEKKENVHKRSLKK